MTRRSGYSVFEVLLAFAIMTLVLSALLPGQAKLLARAGQSDDMILAQDFALSRLAFLSAVRPLETGEVVTTHGPWQSIESVTALESEEARTLYEITVVVRDETGAVIARSTTQTRGHNE